MCYPKKVPCCLFIVRTPSSSQAPGHLFHFLLLYFFGYFSASTSFSFSSMTSMTKSFVIVPHAPVTLPISFNPFSLCYLGWMIFIVLFRFTGSFPCHVCSAVEAINKLLFFFLILKILFFSSEISIWFFLICSFSLSRHLIYSFISNMFTIVIWSSFTMAILKSLSDNLHMCII